MPPKLNKKRGEIAKLQIASTFYASAIRNQVYPAGVMKLYRVTLTSMEPRPTPFGYQSVRIKNSEELAKIKPTLDFLAGKLGWEELPPLLKDLEEQLKQQEGLVSPEIRKIVEQYPKASIAMLKAFDEVYKGKLDIEDFPLISEFVKTVLQSLAGKQKSMIDLQLDVLGKLAKETRPEGMQRLLGLLTDYELPQLTSVTSILTDRLQRLRVFEAEIQNEKAYEIKGKNSIHNQLKDALWIINDSYWLLHSNEPLTNFLHKKYTEGTSEEKDRPDLICATSEKKLVVVELKRPSHDIERKDIDQLQDYLVTADDYGDYDDKAGYLIGKSIPPREQKVVNQIPVISFKSYSTVIEDCNRRYREYLDALQKAS